VEPQRAADSQREKLVPLAQPVNQSRADTETGGDFPNSQES